MYYSNMDINADKSLFTHLPYELIHNIARNVPSHRQVCRDWNAAVLSNFTTVKCAIVGAELTAALAAKIRSRVEMLKLHIGIGHVYDISNILNFSHLRHLDCSNGTDLVNLSPLASCPALQHLKCNNTKVTDLTPLVSCKVLQHLECNQTLVIELVPLASCNVLQHLECNRTLVTDLTPLGSCKVLQHLECNRTLVSDLTPLASCKVLQHLKCNQTLVTDLKPLASCKVLQHIECTATVVSDLTPLASCKVLQHLTFNYTYISNLIPYAFLNGFQGPTWWHKSHCSHTYELSVSNKTVTMTLVRYVPAQLLVPYATN